jgi:hypothetical protein
MVIASLICGCRHSRQTSQLSGFYVGGEQVRANGVETEQVKFDLLVNSFTGESVGVGLDITCTDSPQGAPAWFTPADRLPADCPAA